MVKGLMCQAIKIYMYSFHNCHFNLLSIKQTTSFINPAPYSTLEEHAGNKYEGNILKLYSCGPVVRFDDVL